MSVISSSFLECVAAFFGWTTIIWSVSNSCVHMCLLFTYFGRRNSRLYWNFHVSDANLRPRAQDVVCFVVREMASANKARCRWECSGSISLLSCRLFALCSQPDEKRVILLLFPSSFCFYLGVGAVCLSFPRAKEICSAAAALGPNYLQGVNYVSVLQAKRARLETHVHARPTRAPTARSGRKKEQNCWSGGSSLITHLCQECENTKFTRFQL